MARKKRGKKAPGRKRRRTSAKPRTAKRRTVQRRAKPAGRRGVAVVARLRRIVEAIEEVRQGPLQPELPVDPDAPVAALDRDRVEMLNETQALAEDRPDDSPDRQRGVVLSGGDVDAAWDEVDAGEETVGGSTPTPDQNVVEDLGRAAGVTYSGTEPLRLEEKEAQRDEKRWEVDPASAEDYPDRERERRQRRRKR